MRALFPETYSPKPASSGFTLVEMLVVTAIIVILTSLILFNQKKFGGQVQLQNLAYDIALSVRQAQVYGISVRSSQSQSGSNAYVAGYGMHFDVASPKAYELFSDSVPNGRYDAGEDVPPSPYAIGSGFKIEKLCVPAGTDADSCPALASGAALDILFIRPEPDALINARCQALPDPTDPTGPAVESCQNGSGSARVVLAAPNGQTTSVIVYANGQISVPGAISGI